MATLSLALWHPRYVGHRTNVVVHGDGEYVVGPRNLLARLGEAAVDPHPAVGAGLARLVPDLLPEPASNQMQQSALRAKENLWCAAGHFSDVYLTYILFFLFSL